MQYVTQVNYLHGTIETLFKSTNVRSLVLLAKKKTNSEDLTQVSGQSFRLWHVHLAYISYGNHKSKHLPMGIICTLSFVDVRQLV